MIYIIKSDSYRLLKDKINEITKDIDKSNIESYDLSCDRLKDILESLDYNTLFNEKKGIIVYNSDIFGTKKESNNELSMLESYMDSDNIIIFIESSISLKKKMVKTIKDKGNLIEINTPVKDDLVNYIKKYLSDRNIKIDNNGINKLIYKCDSNIDYILNELDKIIIIRNDYISDSDIDNYVTDISKVNIFDFVDLVIKKDTISSLKMLDKIMDEEIEPAIILSNLASQYRLILSVKNLSKSMSEKSIADTLKIHPYRVKLAKEKSFNYTNSELKEKLLNIGNIDYKIKKGDIDKYNAIKMFLINI